MMRKKRKWWLFSLKFTYSEILPFYSTYLSLSLTHSLFIYLWSSPPFSLQLSVYRNVSFSLSVCRYTHLSLPLHSLSISVCTSISFLSFPLSFTLYLWISLSPSHPLPFNLYLTHIYLPFLSPFDKYHVCHKKTFRLFMGTKHAPQQQSCNLLQKVKEWLDEFCKSYDVLCKIISYSSDVQFLPRKIVYESSLPLTEVFQRYRARCGSLEFKLSVV